jgi:ribulose bisphosphate carboxylase small subunit
MNITEQSFVAEWSHSQQCFHIQKVADMLIHNVEQCMENRGPDYIPLSFFDNYDEASKFIDLIERRKQPPEGA